MMCKGHGTNMVSFHTKVIRGVSTLIFLGRHPTLQWGRETGRRALKTPEGAQTPSNGEPDFWLKQFPGGERAFLQEQSGNGYVP